MSSAIPLPSASQNIRNLFSFWGARVASMLATFIITPVSTNYFGLEIIGIWLLVSHVISHLTLLEMGINSSLSRLLAKANVSGGMPAVSGLVTISLILLSAIGAVILLCYPIIEWVFNRLFEYDSRRGDEIANLLLLAVAFVAVSLPVRTGLGLLASVHRYDLISLCDLVPPILKLGLILLIFKTGSPTLLTFGLVMLLPLLLGYIAQFVLGWSKLRFSLRLNDDAVPAARELVSMSGASLVVTGALMILFQGSAIIAGILSGLVDVALLSYPIMMLLTLMPFVSIANNLIAPIASQLNEMDQRSKIYNAQKISARYGLAAGMVIVLPIWSYSDELFYWWLGGEEVSLEQSKIMAQVFVLIFVGFMLSIPSAIGKAVLRSVGKHWQSANIEVVSNLFGVFVGCLLAVVTSDVIYSLAIGIFLAHVIRAFILLPIYYGRFFDTDFVSILLDWYLAPFKFISFFTLLFLASDYLLVILMPVGIFYYGILILWMSIAAVVLLLRFVVEDVHARSIKNQLSTLLAL